MCKEKEVCEADHDWKDDIPIPDDLGVEKIFVFDSTLGLMLVPSDLRVTDGDAPEWIMHEGILYHTAEFPPGGFVWG